MKIIDKKSKKRISKKGLNKVDPVIRNAFKESEEELSPMDPPDAYDQKRAVNFDYKNLHKGLQKLCDEHNDAINNCDIFEEALNNFKSKGYYISKKTNDTFNSFFHYFDKEILAHNKKEEKILFPVLHQKMIESGEHGVGEKPNTRINLMEDDHVKLIQLASLTFNLLGLALRFKNKESIAITFDLAYNNGVELVELLRLHIYREDNIIFPLAQKLLTKEELKQVYAEL